MKTQVDGGVNWEGRASLSYLRENRGEKFFFTVEEGLNGDDDIGYFSRNHRKIDAAVSGLSKQWDGELAFKEEEYWACLVKDYFVFAKGGMIFSLPVDQMARLGAYGVEWMDDRAFEWLLLSMYRSEWKEWVAWERFIVRENLFVGGQDLSVGENHG